MAKDIFFEIPRLHFHASTRVCAGNRNNGHYHLVETVYALVSRQDILKLPPEFQKRKDEWSEYDLGYYDRKYHAPAYYRGDFALNGLDYGMLETNIDAFTTSHAIPSRYEEPYSIKPSELEEYVRIPVHRVVSAPVVVRGGHTKATKKKNATSTVDCVFVQSKQP